MFFDKDFRSKRDGKIECPESPGYRKSGSQRLAYSDTHAPLHEDFELEAGTYDYKFQDTA